MNTLRMIALVGGIALLAATAHADMVSFQQDAFLTGTATPYTDSQGGWFSGNGYPSVGFTTGSSGYTRGSVTAVVAAARHTPILRFDNIFGSSPGLVPDPSSPAGTTEITNATLTVSYDGAINGVDLHRILVPWTTGTATSATAFGLGPSVGADPPATGEYVGTPVASMPVVGGFNTFDITDVVKGWHEGTFANEGILFTTTNGVGGNDFNLPNEANPNEATRPLLFIEFTTTPPLAPEPGSILLWTLLASLGGFAVWRRRRRAALEGLS